MSNAARDSNTVKTIIGSQDTSPTTLVKLKADNSTHRLGVTYQGTDGTGNDGLAGRDENRVPVMMAVSSADGVTPVALYVNSDGKLLI